MQRATVTQAAVELFLQRGTRGVSISDICAHAEVSRPTFYRCFANKEALVAQLYQDAVNAPIEQLILRQLPSRGVDRVWLREALDAVLDAIFAQRQTALWLYTEASDRTSPAHQIVDQSFDQAAALLISWLYADREPPTATHTVLKSVMAACQWIARDAIEKDLTPAARQDAKQAAWIVISGVLDALPGADVGAVIPQP